MVIKIENGSAYLNEVIQMDLDFFDWPWQQSQWKNLSNDYLLKVAICEKAVCGFILFHLSFDCAHLLKILVAPSYLRKGIAQDLLTGCYDEIKDKSIYLEVAEHNLAAIKFYEKNGLRKLVLKKNFYSDGSSAWAMSSVIK